MSMQLCVPCGSLCQETEDKRRSVLRSALRSAVKIIMSDVGCFKIFISVVHCSLARSYPTVCNLTDIDSMYYPVTKPDHRVTSAGIPHLTVTPQRLL